MKKISVQVQGYRTSISLEPEFHRALKDYAAAGGVSVDDLVTRISDHAAEPGQNLSSAIRVWLFTHEPGTVPGPPPVANLTPKPETS